MVSTELPFPVVNRQAPEVNHQLTLVPRLRMSGAVPQLSLYAFTTLTGTNLPFLRNLVTGQTASIHHRCKAFFRLKLQTG